MLYQGILVGLFVNGIARWGFDSVLQTTGALRGDGQFDSLLPNVSVVLNASVGGGARAVVNGGKEEVQQIAFRWDQPPAPYDGLSVLVNDVERHRWYVGEGERTVTFKRVGDAAVVEGAEEEEDDGSVNTKSISKQQQLLQLQPSRWEEWINQTLLASASSDSTAEDELRRRDRVRAFGDKQYFRFGFMQGSGAADYTKAGVWEEDGGWVDMEEGAS